MNQQEFVASLRSLARDAAVEGVLSLVLNPPGRKPSAELRDLSEWYGRMSDEDRGRLRRMLEMVSQHAVFGVLSLIDGARQVEATSGPKGHFELRHVNIRGEATQIAGPGTGPLHEVL